MENQIDYTSFINTILKDMQEFVSQFNLKVKLLKTYEWNSDIVGIYKYRSAYKGTIRIGVNLDVINDYADELYDLGYSDILVEQELYNNVSVTLWHEVGHGLMEHIRRMRRLDTQRQTGIFRGQILKELKEIIYDEEDIVEEFGEYMAGFGYSSKLYDFLMKYKDVLQY